MIIFILLWSFHSISFSSLISSQVEPKAWKILSRTLGRVYNTLTLFNWKYKLLHISLFGELVSCIWVGWYLSEREWVSHMTWYEILFFYIAKWEYIYIYIYQNCAYLQSGGKLCLPLDVYLSETHCDSRKPRKSQQLFLTAKAEKKTWIPLFNLTTTARAPDDFSIN